MCRPPTQDELEESEPSLARTFWRLRAVALVACCDEALFSFATGATHYPYLRTLVRCHARSSSFSGSARCGDADVVLQRGARLGGWATFAVVVGNVLCVLLWAPRIDSLGRRHTIVRSLAGLAVGLGALACAAQLDSVALSLGAYVAMAATSATQAAAAALASDAYEKDARQRRALAVVNTARGAGTVAAPRLARRSSTTFALAFPVCQSRRTAQPASPKRHRGFAVGFSSTARRRATCGLTAPSAAALGAPASSSSNSCSSTGTGDPPPRRCSSLPLSSSDPPEESPPVPPSSATRHIAMCFRYRAVPRLEEASAARTAFGHGTQLIWHQARYISQAEALHTAPASYRSNWRYISLALHIGPAAMCSAGAGTYRPGLLHTASGNIAQHWREKRSRVTIPPAGDT